MRLAVTGALGHIGSRFIRSIPERWRAEVVLIDNLSTQRYASLFNLPMSATFRFIEADIRTADLEQLFRGVDVVVHLAAITDATSSFGKAEEVEAVNLGGTERVARASAAVGAALIFPSTTSVYGVSSGVVDESCPPEQLKPQSPYAASKLAAEGLLTELGRTMSLRFVTVRFGTIFGTSVGMRFHTAVNKFCWQAVMGQPLSVWRTAYDQQRPYLDLSDAVSAIRFIIDHELFAGELYNIVTTNATVREIVERIQQFLPETRVEFVDERIMNQLSYTVSSELFGRRGFTFAGDLTEGIAETVALLRQS